jgi:hypothetical protein
MNRFRALWPLALVVFAGCDDAPAPVDRCTHEAAAAVTLGQGVGGSFDTITPEQTVGLAVAPQGGFGVTVLARTEGLFAGDETLVRVRLETLIDDEVTGSFLIDAQPSYCQGDGTGGLITGIVVGFDSAVYRSNNDLLALDGQRVQLRVTVTDADGVSAVGAQHVIVKVGQ